MNPFKKVLGRPNKNKKMLEDKAPGELQEIGEIMEKLIIRLDKKINTLKALEEQADEKITLLNNLIHRSKTTERAGKAGNEPLQTSRAEVENLAAKGFKPEEIARILDLPSGEVELILNLVH